METTDKVLLFLAVFLVIALSKVLPILLEMASNEIKFRREYKKLDDECIKAVHEFNKKNGFKEGDEHYVDPEESLKLTKKAEGRL